MCLVAQIIISLLGEALKVNDCLLDITKRYNDVVNKKVTIVPNRQQLPSTDLLTSQFSKPPPSTKQVASTLDELNEIFSNHSTPTPTSFVTDLLKPTPVQSSMLMESGNCTFSELENNIEPVKPKPLQLIDNISEDLFKEVLSTGERQGSFKK